MDHPDGEIGEDGHYYKCVICDDGGDLLCCDTCPGVYHLQCLDPPLEHVPAGSWQCQRCCQKDISVRPAKSLKSWRRPESSDNTMEELDAAEVLANKMSISHSCDKQQEAKAADVDSDGLIDAPQALETVQNVVSSDRRNHLLDVWSEEEVDALWVGVCRYGPGNWQMMLEDPILKFSTSKTPQDLSLRWEIERQWILNGESFQASPYEVSRTRGILKIYYEARKPSASSSSKTNDSNPAAEWSGAPRRKDARKKQLLTATIY